jgi:hypothetical protein
VIERAQKDHAFQMFLARSFGRQAVFWDGNTKVVGYHWRGVFYITRLYHGLKHP